MLRTYYNPDPYGPHSVASYDTEEDAGDLSKHGSVKNACLLIVGRLRDVLIGSPLQLWIRNIVRLVHDRSREGPRVVRAKE
jgi:hypothetical protein